MTNNDLNGRSDTTCSSLKEVKRLYDALCSVCTLDDEQFRDMYNKSVIIAVNGAYIQVPFCEVVNSGLIELLANIIKEW